MPGPKKELILKLLLNVVAWHSVGERDANLVRDGSQRVAHALDRNLRLSLSSNDNDLVADLRIDPLPAGIGTQVDFEHALIHADIPNLMAANPSDDEIGAP